MKKISSYCIFLFFLLGFLFFTACNPIVKPELLPVLTTTEVNAITQTSATSGGNITTDAGSSVTARGVCWSTKASPTIADSKTTDGAGIGSFTSSITGLTAVTTYYVRAYATTSTGTGYGGAYQFTTIVATPITPTVTDADGNVYHTVKIGTQTWMVENLKTTKYKDGTAIPLITDNTVWAPLSTPAYCWYNNDATTYKNTYGALYNWYAVNTAKLAPTGWHVPTDAEWTTLENYVSANPGTSGSVAKALAATTNWTTDTSAGAIGNNLTKNNSSGFSALPGGARLGNGTFTSIGGGGCWWSSTEDGTTEAWYRDVYYNNYLLNRYSTTKSYGFSVRCVMD
jgi:uncharacterized protein (TIGR02145 family)